MGFRESLFVFVSFASSLYLGLDLSIWCLFWSEFGCGCKRWDERRSGGEEELVSEKGVAGEAKEYVWISCILDLCRGRV